MRVVIAGGHGRIALLLEQCLAGGGDEAVGIVRNPAHAADLAAAGATAVVADLETSRLDEVAETVAGADAVVFAAGAGPGSGASRKLTVDRDAAILLADAAAAVGVRRYLMVSAMRADEADPDSDDVFQIYLRAKAAADADLRGRDLDWTIVRPGRLTDDPGTGRVRLADHVPYGEVPRADVAAVLAGALTQPATIRRQFDVVSGDTPVESALRL
ncbi:MAG: NAD(P)H-binding protein [Streptosporangiales bacterium]|nr:NAD(P)H-binding protein [Streptosporangiales bacterium]MBO0890584.1 NAD(P)H-binding protein [Acidothermales bacterium]